MKRTYTMAVAILLVVAFTKGASAVEIKTGGTIFAHYEYVTSEHLKDGTKAKDFNAFDVSRVYLNLDAAFSDTVRGFVQYETNLISREETANSVFVKQALLEIKEVYPDAKVMFGLIPSSWRGYEEGIWRHRFVSKILDDVEGLFSATDRGVRLNGKAPFLEYDFAVVNGEGIKNNEVNRYKDLAAKVAIAPFKEGALSGLKINAHLQEGAYDQDLPRDRFIGGLSYESKRFNIMGSSYNATDQKTATSTEAKGEGFSIHGVYNFSEKCNGFARYDSWDPDTKTSDDDYSKIFIGTGYKVTDGVRLALDWQALNQKRETATRKDEQFAALHAEIKF